MTPIRKVDGRLTLKPSVKDWDLKQRERQIFESSERIPNWRLADKCRRHLGATAEELSKSLPSLAGVSLEDLDDEVARRMAVISASGIAMRSASSALMLVSTGYVIEAAGPLRRLLEAKLHSRAVLDEESSAEYARRFLRRRGMGLTKLAQRYGSGEEVKVLSVISHADVGALQLAVLPGTRIGGGGPIEQGAVSMLPELDADRAISFLYVVSYELVSMAALAGEAFDITVEAQAWVSRKLEELEDIAGWPLAED